MFELGIWSLVGIVAFVISGIVAAEADSALASVLAFVIAITTLEVAMDISILSLIAANPLWLFVILVFYIAVGAGYTAFWRWPEYIRQRKDKIMQEYYHWASSKDATENNSFDAFMDSSSYRFNASQHKERLGTWVGMWPFSLTWELSRKPAIWMWNVVYDGLGNLFQRIGRRTARKLHEEN